MSLPRYPEYKDSGVTGLGEMPAHWGVLPLKRELAFLTSGSRGWAEHYADDGALFLRIGNLTRDSVNLDLSDIQRVKVPDGAEGERTKVQPGDVLFSITAYLGSVAVIPKNFEPAFVSQHVALARLRAGKVTPLWVAYVTLSTVGKTYLAEQGYGGTKVQLSLNDVANLPVTVPPLNEQRSILEFLDRETGKIDALIAEQEKLLTLLAEKRQATMSHAVTRGLNPNAPMRDSGVAWLGVVPAHWEMVRLGQIFREVAESGDDTLPILSVSIHDGVSDKELNDDELDRKVTRSDDRSKYKKVVRGDLVYNMMRAWQGGFGTVETTGMVSPAYVVARPVEESFLTGFVEQLLRTPQGVQEMKRYSRGITDFRLRLYWDEFKNIKIPLPPLLEQEQIMLSFGETASYIDGLSERATSAIGLLKERRSALIAAAVTGKIDVRDTVSEELAA